MRSHIRGQLLRRRIHQDAVHDHGWKAVVSRLPAVVLLAAVALSLVAPAANAVPKKKLDDNLAAMWTTVLQTPKAQNPFFTGGGCYDIGGGTVAPFGLNGAKSCTVKPGTKIFVAASSVECSTFEGHGTTEDKLRTCASDMDVKVAPSVTVDGRSLPVSEVETRLLHIVVPADNILDDPPGHPVPAGPGLSVAHGWVVLLHPLTPGTHTIVINVVGKPTITTTILVKPGH
jgi:hypothetical protein